MTKQLYHINYCRFDPETKTPDYTFAKVWSTSPDDALGVFGDNIKEEIVEIVSMRISHEFGTYEEWNRWVEYGF